MGLTICPPSEFVCFLIWGRYLDFSGMSCHVLLRSYGFHVGIHIIVFDASQIRWYSSLQVPQYLGVRWELFFFFAKFLRYQFVSTNSYVFGWFLPIANFISVIVEVSPIMTGTQCCPLRLFPPQLCHKTSLLWRGRFPPLQMESELVSAPPSIILLPFLS